MLKPHRLWIESSANFQKFEFKILAQSARNFQVKTQKKFPSITIKFQRNSSTFRYHLQNLLWLLTSSLIHLQSERNLGNNQNIPGKLKISEHKNLKESSQKFAPFSKWKSELKNVSPKSQKKNSKKEKWWKIQIIKNDTGRFRILAHFPKIKFCIVWLSVSTETYGQFLIKIGFNLTVLFLNFGLLIYLFKFYVLHCIVFFNQ